MNNKLLFIIITIILFVSIFTVLTTVVNAKSLNLFCVKKQNLIIILKDEADIEKSKTAISKIPKIKITKIQDRNKEWSRMVNKMDLPKMENPFKNEFTVKIKKKANTDEIYNKIKEMNFVEDVKYLYDTRCEENNN